jgi:hypothetical protein
LATPTEATARAPLRRPPAKWVPYAHQPICRTRAVSSRRVKVGVGGDRRGRASAGCAAPAASVSTATAGEWGAGRRACYPRHSASDSSSCSAPGVWDCPASALVTSYGVWRCADAAWQGSICTLGNALPSCAHMRARCGHPHPCRTGNIRSNCRALLDPPTFFHAPASCTHTPRSSWRDRGGGFRRARAPTRLHSRL